MRAIILILFSVLLPTIAESSPGEIHYVKHLQAKIHVAPTSKSKIKFIVAIGRKLLEFDRKNGWINVGIDKTGGKDGWIQSADVKSTDPDGVKH